MSFRRDSLAVLLDRVYANYTSLFAPLGKPPRNNLLKVFASVDAGMYHQLLGDLDFLARQIFPDTAEGPYLREHWSGRVTPLYAIPAQGTVTLTGTPGRSVPAGLLMQSGSGEQYYTEAACHIGAEGTAEARVTAQNTGVVANLDAGEELKIISALPPGIDTIAVAAGEGLKGGADDETDAEYLARVLLALRNPGRYGKVGDFALWAVDSSVEVSSAWEFKNFSVFGALLIQVIKGSQIEGVSQVDNLALVRSYLDSVAPPVMYEVRTPELVSLNPSLALLPQEDTQQNRETAVSRMKTYLQVAAEPGASITAGALRTAVIDGVDITGAQVLLGGSAAGIMPTTILQYPVLGEVEWV
jgi:uncharacterized phage protein gp47/JayE